MATNGRPVQSGGATGDDTSTHYTNTTGDYSDPDIREDPDMHGMRHDYDGVMRRQRMMSRATKTGATWEGERSYGEDWDASDMDPQKFRSKARGIARGQGGGNGQGRQGGGDAIHELIPIYIPSPGMDSTISRGGSDPDGISGDTLAVIINNGGESHKHKEGEGKMYGSMDNFMAGLLAGGNGCGGNSNNNGGGFWGGDSLALIILLLLFGANGGGFGNGGLGGVAGVDRTIVNERNASLLMDAISSNGIRQENALTSLASNLNCSVGSIKDILCSLAQGQAVQFGGLQAAIEAMGCKISSEQARCCCEGRLMSERQGAETRAQIADLSYNMASQFAAQTNQIQQAICNQNSLLLDQFGQIKTREDAKEIQRLRDEVANQRASAQTALLLQAINGARGVSGTLDTTAGTFSGISQTGILPT